MKLSKARPSSLLSHYDVQLGWRDRLAADIKAITGRLRCSIERNYWSKVPRNQLPFIEFLKDQVYRLCPKLFSSIPVEADPETDEYLKRGNPAIYASIHHGFFTLIPFVVAWHYGLVMNAIGTAPSRNLNPSVNPDHKVWKYFFYYQFRRFLGQRIIFSDEPPSVILDWLRHGYGALILIDVVEVGHKRKTRPVNFIQKQLSLPDTALRLSRLTNVPLIAANLYFRDNGPVLTLGKPLFTTKENEDAVFSALCQQLLLPVISYPEQQFFDIFGTFCE